MAEVSGALFQLKPSLSVAVCRGQRRGRKMAPPAPQPPAGGPGAASRRHPRAASGARVPETSVLPLLNPYSPLPGADRGSLPLRACSRRRLGAALTCAGPALTRPAPPGSAGGASAAPAAGSGGAGPPWSPAGSQGC